MERCGLNQRSPKDLHFILLSWFPKIPTHIVTLSVLLLVLIIITIIYPINPLILLERKYSFSPSIKHWRNGLQPRYLVWALIPYYKTLLNQTKQKYPQLS